VLPELTLFNKDRNTAKSITFNKKILPSALIYLMTLCCPMTEFPMPQNPENVYSGKWKRIL
jgi:hypothetical protein